MAACIAAKGIEVIGVDLDLQKVTAIQQKRPPVYETGLAEMIEKAGERLTATQNLQEAFIVVATPQANLMGTSSCRMSFLCVKELEKYFV